ncbi:hypothetical protein PoB_003562900 [Plakobranchus ocellatus]|uniref:Uncharacterized protein n=1 Tax=Plakobranchus ocellatus TaxID=259542 RepID=A0AAV4AMV3_9GAST|nr:hypothetical protein PoB_003562900 [Plakobranchus ocellatus]
MLHGRQTKSSVRLFPGLELLAVDETWPGWLGLPGYSRAVTSSIVWCCYTLGEGAFQKQQPEKSSTSAPYLALQNFLWMGRGGDLEGEKVRREKMRERKRQE